MSGKAKGWWGRNWKWFVPVGCLGILICLVALVAVCIGIGYTMITSSAPYQAAVSAAQSDPRVIAALGSPVKQGLFFNGNIKESTDWSSASGSTNSGWADFYIEIHGPKGKGKIHVSGTKANGKWIYQTLTVKIEATKEVIDLNQKPKKSENRKVGKAGPMMAGQRVFLHQAG